MNKRCEEIIRVLKGSDKPVTAASFAERLNVSRQIIVGDVALIRASGYDITATSRGYVMSDKAGDDDFAFIGMIACRHTGEQLQDELYTIVDHGATVIDVAVEHAIYGELSGKLDLSSRYDVDMFVRKIAEEKNSAPISILTNGIHLHRIGCRNRETFERISNELKAKGILYENQ